MTDVTNKILIVEDEVVIAMEIEAMLVQLGYEVSGIAGGGEEAVSLAERLRPDLVLMDIRLGSGMDGITAAEEIGRLYAIPVVFLTAHSDRRTLERAMKIQPSGYLLKPFRKNDLATSIEIALYRHRALVAERGLNRELFKQHVIDHVTQYDICNKLLGLSGFLSILEMEIREGTATTGRIGKIREILAGISRQIRFEEDYQKLGLKSAAWHAISPLVRAARDTVVPAPVRVDDRTGSLEIFADPLIGQVFPRLFENSVQHGTKVTAITVSFRETGEGAFLVIEDDGTGIGLDRREDLFTTDLLRAKGKGLFLVREILQVSGMTIRETGEPGTGARFEIAIPGGQYRFAKEVS